MQLLMPFNTLIYSHDKKIFELKKCLKSHTLANNSLENRFVTLDSLEENLEFSSSTFLLKRICKQYLLIILQPKPREPHRKEISKKKLHFL